MARGADCTRCPLYKQGRGPVLPQLVPNSPLVVIGEAPGKWERKRGAPFVGESGQVLNNALAQGGLPRGAVTITNTILCQPPDEYDFESYLDAVDRKGQESPVTCCSKRLKADLADANSTVELAVGAQALKAMAQHHQLTFGHKRNKAEAIAKQQDDDSDAAATHIAHMRRQHGSPVIIRDGAPRKVLLACYHPAYAMRGAKAWMPVIQSVITRAARIAVRKGALDWVKPTYNVDPTIEEVEAFAETVVSQRLRVVEDTETDGIVTQTCRVRCVGLGAVIDGRETIIIVPFRDMEGRLAWGGNKELLRRAALAVRRIMDNCEIIGQNIVGFDTAVLMRNGLMTPGRKECFDTALAAHDTDFCDMPKDLRSLCAYFFEAPNHKDDADHKAVGKIGYHKLKVYCGDDILVTMRVADKLRDRIDRLKTWAQFATDTKLAPIVRDMGDLGLVIDERRRVALQESLTVQVAKYDLKFKFGMSCLLMDDVKLAELRRVMHAKRDSEAARTDVMHDVVREYRLDSFNANSPPQLREWLYGTCDLTPVLNTEGHDYDEEDGDDPSTGVAAVLKLQEKYPHMQGVLDALLEYRAYNKLLSTYVADKKKRIRTVDWTQYGLPHCDWLRILNVSYKAHVVPSGRLASTPNCFDDQTDILTKRGWIRFAELRSDDLVAQYNTDGSIEFVVPTQFIARSFDGDLITLSGRSVDLAVTPDHRMLLQRGRPKAGTPAKYIECTADEWVSSTTLYLRHAGVHRAGELALSAAQLALICAAQADGYVNSSDEWEFSFTKHRKIERLRWALEALGITWREADKQNGEYVQRRFRVSRDQMSWLDTYVSWRDEQGAYAADSKTFGPWVTELTQEALRLFTRETWHWDGCHTRQNHYSSSVKAAADWVQIAHVLSDERAKLRSYENRGTTLPNWQVDVIKNRATTCTGAHADNDAPVTKARRRYTGIVYCVSVPSSYIVVRRGGKPVVVGQCQNWPAFGKANMRTMVGSPPGHVIVGADFDQLELRIYAAVSGDKLLLQAFAEDLDPHSLNAASLLAKNEGELWDWYHKIKNAESKYKKYWRTVAKRFAFLECLAEGSQVLTKRGLVAIERVRLSDKVWDGVEWVSHDGVVCRGYKEVITYDGVTATPDHNVWTTAGEKRELRQVRADKQRIARTGAGRYPVRFVGNADERIQAGQVLSRHRTVCGAVGLQRGGVAVLAESNRSDAPRRYDAEGDIRRVRVYDIINAGPRRRFTAGGRLVSNCYGGGEGKLYATMAASRDKATGKRDFPELTPDEVKVWHERWHRMHPETRDWQQMCKDFANANGYIGVAVIDYRKRFWPGGVDNENKPPNHTIQGFAGSVANRGLIALADAIPHRGWSLASGLFLQVHDYIAAYVPRERAWEAKHLLEELMPFTYEGLKFSCTAEISQYWSDQG